VQILVTGGAGYIGSHTARELLAAGDEVVLLRALGKRVRLLRLVRELSQGELAHAAGISRSFLSLIEKGGHGVDVIRLIRLAEVLDVSLLELLDVGSAVADRVEGLPS
jgi:transcriptional regulator with XRE-family HTH domain